MIDNYDRHINYARISITDLCNLRCRYCMPSYGVCKKNHNELLSIEQIIKVATSLVELGIEKIRITGGEPLVRKGVDKLFEQLGKLPIKKLALTSNGMLIPQYINDITKNNVNAVNISIDSLNSDRFYQSTRGGDLKQALKGLEVAIANGLKVKVNTVLQKGINDNELNDFIQLAREKKIEVRFIELMPIGQEKNYAKEYFIDSRELIKQLVGFNNIGYENNSTAEYYTDGVVKIGFIRAMTNKFCSSCNRIRITADGKVIPCLHNSASYDIKNVIDDNLTEVLREIILKKPIEHRLESGVIQKLDMHSIGG